MEAPDTALTHDAGALAPLTVIVLTFNAAPSIRQVVDACRTLAGRILVVDSYSQDDTVAIAGELGCEVLQHPFENYAAQRNWAQAQAGLAPDAWVLHLDADEVLTPELAAAICRVVTVDDPAVDGYLMRRLSYFLGHPIRHGAINPSWHLRLFRAGKGMCEERLYDQHFLCDGPTDKLTGLLHDLQLTSIESWTASHNRWSSAEAAEVLRQRDRDFVAGRTLEASLRGDLRMKKRWIKNVVWYRTPLFFRAFAFFFYAYVVRLGFLDGRVGLVYHVLQAFWFRFLVDAKLLERQLRDADPR